VLKALRAHDEALGEELDELRRRLGARRAASRRPGKIIPDFPAGRVGADFIRAFKLRLVEQTTASWEFYFGLVERFVAREGQARVPHPHQENGVRLGSWVDKQRQAYRRGTLDPERRARLEALEGWVWDPYQADWEDGYARLREFVAREGHARVARGHQDDDGFKLGVWISKQRARGRRGELPDERVRRLESVPGWTWDARQPARAR
jgi:Helicase associated domain